MIQREIFPAIILNDGGINDWIRPCHERLSALALCPFFLLTPLFSSFPPLFLRFRPNPLLPSFPRPPTSTSAAIFFPFILPCQAYVFQRLLLLNRELLIELYSPAWAHRATPAHGSGGHARLFTFLCCFQKGGIFVPSKKWHAPVWNHRDISQKAQLLPIGDFTAGECNKHHLGCYI